MEQDEWYQVKYNAEGNVIDVKMYGDALKGESPYESDGYEFVTDYTDIATAVVEEDVVLYFGWETTIPTTVDLTMTGRTLWVDTNRTTGFRVAEDVNVALLQRNNNVSRTYFESGVSALNSMLSELNERHDSPDTTHDYTISAILEDGVATSIVINDKDRSCDPYRDADYEEATGDLILTGINFTGTGIRVYFENQTGVTLSGNFVATLEVRSTSGSLIWSGSDASPVWGGLADGASSNVSVGDYANVPSTTADYTVTLTLGVDSDNDGVVDGATYSGTATLGTV